MNKFLETFKENKEIIILIPTIVGGLYQVLNLILLVGMPYVRYFSVAQVIPDGLLISIAIFWLYIIYKIALNLYQQTLEDNSNQVNHSVLFNLSFIIFLCTVGAYLLYCSYNWLSLSSFGAIIIRYLTGLLGILFFWIGLHHLIKVSKLAESLKKFIIRWDVGLKKFLINIFIIVGLSISIRIVTHEITIINQVFIKVNNFENYSLFIKKIQTHYQLKDVPELLYINKDYAFFRILDNQKILVVDAKSITELKKSPESSD